MGFYCDVSDEKIKLKSKNKPFKSNSHKEFDKYEYINVTIENPNLKDIDEIFQAYIIDHNEKCDFYLIKCEFKLVFNDNQCCPHVMSELYCNRTMCCWYKVLEKLFSDFKDKGYNFNDIAETKIITKANKLDMSYDFYVKHNMLAVGWKLFSIFNKDKNSINKFNCKNWLHPIFRKYSHIPFNI